MPRPVGPALAALLALGAVTACAEDSPPTDAPSPGGSVAVSSSTANPAVDPSLAPTEPATPAADFTITYRAGKVSGDTGRLKVTKGDTVTIEVISDVADEAHLHGYDVSVEVVPGAPARLTFVAELPGVFHLELEKLHKQLASVQVQ
ncbi:MAG TPA: hypothetical protein VNA30_07200 [Mycobacteriales bacterium]|nr:hypothetical protein [Mycobacteriales bacterium]